MVLGSSASSYFSNSARARSELYGSFEGGRGREDCTFAGDGGDSLIAAGNFVYLETSG